MSGVTKHAMASGLQRRLADWELMLVEQRLGYDGWELSVWPDPRSEVHGMRVDRIHRLIGKSRLMLHRFEPTPGADNPVLHSHPFALAAHVLGPGTYELGLGRGKRITSRTLCAGPFYYEMLEHEVAHYVLPKTGPVYSVAAWVPYEEVPPLCEPLRDPSEGANAVPEAVEGYFKQLYG